MGHSTPAAGAGTFLPGDALAPAPSPLPASSLASFHLSLRLSRGIYGCAPRAGWSWGAGRGGARYF